MKDFRLRDVLGNIKENSNNKQKSTYIKGKKLKEMDMDMDEFLDLKIKSKKLLFNN